MINFIFRINHPYPKDGGRKQHDYVMWGKSLSTNWATELQITRWAMTTLFELRLDLSWSGGDHAGPGIHVELLGFMFNFRVYNKNHWNWDTGQFYTKEEALAEYEEELRLQEETNE